MKFRPLAAEYEPHVEVLKNTTGKEPCGEGPTGFTELFKDRFKKLSRVLRAGGFNGAARDVCVLDGLAGLQQMPDRRPVIVVGMVADKHRSAAGNVVIKLEDVNDTILALAFKNSTSFAKSEYMVPDEVVGIVGSVRNGGGRARIFVNDIVWPDLPGQISKTSSDALSSPLSVAMISDLHVGSDKFLEESFLKFTQWLHTEAAGNVKYIIVAGDVVDGIGVYPGQEKELLIGNVFKQYEVAAKLLAEIPDYMTVIVIPGNHDAVRGAEPQPPIPKDVASDFHGNVMMLGNPALVSIEGVRILAYHGKGLDDIIGLLPGLSYQRPAQAMTHLLQKRHLAPVYGGKVMTAPLGYDALVVDDPVPDVLLFGHAHVCDHAVYKGVQIVNSGTFQSTTEFIRKRGIEPTPGRVPILNLQTKQIEVIDFA